MPLRSITFLLCFLGSSALAMAFPMAGVVCYIVLYHVYPQTTWWGQRLECLGIRYAFVCGLCLLIGTVLNLNRLPFGRRFMHPIEWCVLLTFLAMLLSTATGAPWDDRTEMVLDKMSKVILFTLLLSHVVVTQQRVWQVTILLTVLALYLGHEATNAPPGAFANNRLNGIGGPDFRESAGLAIHLFAVLPFVAIVMRQRSLALKALAFFAGCYSVNAILLCRARSAFVAGIVAGLLAIWYIPRHHRRWVVGVLVVGAAGGVVLSDNWFWERMITILSPAEQRDTSASSRLDIWAAAWQLLKANPLGVGIGHFESAIGDYSKLPEVRERDAHNSFVLCAAETGVPGLVFYLTTILASWLTLSRLARRVRSALTEPDRFELLIFANRLGIVVYLVGGLFVSRFYTEGAWWLLVLPVCLSRAVENEIRAEAREQIVLVDETPCHNEPDAVPALTRNWSLQ